MEKKWIKLIRRLQLKKYRKETGLFTVEGAKTVRELLQADFKIQALFYTDLFEKDYPQLIGSKSFFTCRVKTHELTKAGVFKTNQAAIAVAAIKKEKSLRVANEIVLVLDQIRDPSNLGAILRVADWYGIKKVVCSETSADLYNPKVLTASMGSFCRTRVYYADIAAFLKSKQGNISIFGTFIQGKNIHKCLFPKQAIIVFGNESRGISKELLQYIDQKISIPKYGGAESLNVAVAFGVICDNVKRGINNVK